MKSTLSWVLMWGLGITATHGWWGNDARSTDYSRVMKLWGDRPFTAKVIVWEVDKKGRETELMKSDYAHSKRRLRIETRMGETGAGQKRKKAADEMSGMGMDHIILLVLPKEKGSYMIYPGLASYCLLEAPEAAGVAAGEPTITRQELGKETVDGRACIKSLVTVQEGQSKVTMTVWEALDLDRFPIQTEMVEDGKTIRTRFQDLQFKAPPDSLFALPQGYTRYNSVQEMMMGAMQRMMGGD